MTILLPAILLPAGLFLALTISPAVAGRDVRVVVIEADGPANAEAIAQADALLAQRDGLRERDMVVFARFGDAPAVQLFGDASSLPRRAAGASRGPFLVLLFGKDGGEKLRSSQPVSAEDLFGLIDGMPMRRQEMGR